MILERDGLTWFGPVRALEIKDGAFREVRCPWCQGREVVRLCHRYGCSYLGIRGFALH